MPSKIYFDLMEACEQPGCPICRIVLESSRRYLENLFYENVNDRSLRAQLRAGRGFCNNHAWMLLELGTGDALGVAIIYHDVMGSILKELPSPAAAERNGISALLGQIPRQLSIAIKTAVAALSPQAPCPACLQRDSSTQNLIAVLSENLQETRVSTALGRSAGLCIPHLRQALERVRSDQDFNNLLDLHREKLQALRDELAELIRKSDYRFREEEIGSERDAWRRAVSHVAGDRFAISE